MRNILVYALYGIALWYLSRAVMRRYLGTPQNTSTRGRESDRNRSGDAGDGSYRNARDVRYRDIE